MKDTWDLIKSIYSTLYSVSPSVIDHIAVYEILEMCCKGYSITSISRKLNFDTEYIADCCKEFLYFNGFTVDTSINIRDIYNKYKHNKYAFTTAIKSLDSLITDSEAQQMYKINYILDTIKKGLDNYYANDQSA